jgi:leucyl/phenylalanyl-tRNA--protein transferase
MQINIRFPDPRETNDDGLVAVGGELSLDYLISAYAQGVFPWFNENDPILWWSPNPRMVLFPDDFKASKSLRQLVNSNRYTLKIDNDFTTVMGHCRNVKRKDQEGTWITDEMVAAYTKLHEFGIAHSFETYAQHKLVGGLYGVSLGRAFFGESMFFTQPNASKFAFFNLVQWCKHHDFHFIDAQQSTRHMKSLGAKDISRDDFLDELNEALKHPTQQGKWSILKD